MKTSTLVLALPLLIACGDDDPKSSTVSFESRLSAAYCDYADRCAPYDSSSPRLFLSLPFGFRVATLFY